MKQQPETGTFALLVTPQAKTFAALTRPDGASDRATSDLTVGAPAVPAIRPDGARFPTLRAVNESRLIASLIVGFTLAWVGFALREIRSAAWLTITRDQWRFYSDYFRLPFPDDILHLQNGHPSVFPGLLRLIDVELFDASNRFVLFAGHVFVWAALGLLTKEILSSPRLPLTARSVVGVAPWIAVYWMANARVLVHDPILAFGLCLVCLVGGTVGLRVGADAYRRRSAAGDRFMLVAGSCCLVATFSFGAGIALWGVLVVVGIHFGLPRRGFAVLGLFLLAASIGRLRMPGRNSVGVALDVVDIVTGGAIWLGGPAHTVAGWGPTASGVVGALVTVLAITLIGRQLLSRPARRTPLDAHGLSWTLFGGATALQVAVGRGTRWTDTPENFLGARYLPWVMIFWTGLLFLLAAELAQVAARDRRRAHGSQRLAVLTAAIVFSAAVATWSLIPSHRQAPIRYETANTHFERASMSLLAGVNSDTAATALFRRATVVHSLANVFRQKELAMFATPEAGLVGASLRDNFAVVEHASVVRYDGAERSGDGLKFAGRVREEGPPVDYDVVVSLDGSGVIDGLAKIEESGYFEGYAMSMSTSLDLFLVDLDSLVAAPISP